MGDVVRECSEKEVGPRGSERSTTLPANPLGIDLGAQNGVPKITTPYSVVIRDQCCFLSYAQIGKI